MYNLLKSIVKSIIPKKTLIKNEESYRKLLAPFYRGKKHECNICKTKLNHFSKLHNQELICPICGSLPRTRRLYVLMEKEFLKPGFFVLDFSPSRILYRKLKKRKDIAYFPSDFEDDFLSDYRYDITNIDSEDNKFDLIICYHILEHITEDSLAMNELYRVLKKNGTLLIQTPFKEGEIYEDPTIISPQEKLTHFGQEDHVRIYSVLGLEKRLNKAGLTTEIRTFEADPYYGLTENEKVIVCTK